MKSINRKDYESLEDNIEFHEKNYDNMLVKHDLSSNNYRKIEINPPINDIKVISVINTKSKKFSIYLLLVSLLMILLIILRFLIQNLSYNMNVKLSRIIPYKIITHPTIPSSLWGTITKPFPTGSFFTNIALGDQPIAVIPYGVKTLDTGIQVSYGPMHRQVHQNSISDTFMPDLQISAVETYISHSIEKYDNISVTMTYKVKDNSNINNNLHFKTHLVKGSPFITVIYDSVTPVLSSIMQFIRVDARIYNGGVGVTYLLTLGNFQKWLLYCSEPVVFRWKDNTLTSPTPIKGFLRLAILPLQNTEDAFTTLLNYVQKYPIGCNITFSYGSSIDSVSYNFNTVGTGPLLMLALPHHMKLFSTPSVNDYTEEMKVIQRTYAPILSIKGKLTPIIGEIWKLSYNIPSVSWNYIITDKLSTTQLDEIAKQLIEDIKEIVPSSLDIYSFGKEVARMARLTLIADNLGISDTRANALATIEKTIIPWLQGSNENSLLYDRTYGGIVSVNGINDPNAEFGSGWYNDHHFHYGYFVYALAVIAKLDTNFIDINRNSIDAIVRDICNYDSSDPDFPFFRHKDLFDGHSWASGLFNQANGKGQESSSEAVNAYYSCYLYGIATSNHELSKISSLMMSMEIQSVLTYWHMSDDSIYDPIFSSFRMVGNIGGLDVTSSTWFGNQPEYVHGINMMPITPVTALLFDQSYVKLEHSVMAINLVNTAISPEKRLCSASRQCSNLGLTGDCCPSPEGSYLGCCNTTLIGKGYMSDEWKSLIYINSAIINRDNAWNNIMQLNNFGQGGSKSNSLFWTASRSEPISNSLVSNWSRDPHTYVKKECSANTACVALNVVGDCCPNEQGIFLGCCPTVI